MVLSSRRGNVVLLVISFPNELHTLLLQNYKSNSVLSEYQIDQQSDNVFPLFQFVSIAQLVFQYSLLQSPSTSKTEYISYSTNRTQSDTVRMQ